MDKQDIIDARKKAREGERIFYTSCPNNGCWDSACILKCHEKDGKLIAIEPDDSINAGMCREDVEWESIWRGMVQMRPCSMGHAWKEELYGETRLTHPMKRIGEKGPGKGYFVEIGWEEALDTIAEKMIEIKEKYGFDAHAIVTMQDVIDHLYNRPYKGEVYIDDTLKKAIDEYYAVYGA